MRAISSFSLESGTSTFWCRALMALRTRVRKSATGSVKLMLDVSSNRRPLAFLSGSNSGGPPRALSLRVMGLKRTSRDVLTGSAGLQAGSTPLTSIFARADFSPRGKLPRRLRNAGNFPLERQAAEAQTAEAELAQIGPRTSANVAAVVRARGELGFLVRLGDLACCSHRFLYSGPRPLFKLVLLGHAEGHSHMLQQRPRLVVITRRGHNRDVHSLHLLDLRVVDFGEDQLVARAQREIAASIERLGGHAAEVAHGGQRHIHQPVKEFIHA